MRFRRSETHRPSRPGLLLALGTALFVAGLAQADVPRLIHVQGQLTNPDGSGVGTTVETVTFRLRAVPSNAVRWNATRSVTVTDSHFAETLGPFAPTLRFDERLCVSVQVGSDPELGCGILVSGEVDGELSATAYAMRAAWVAAEGVDRAALAVHAVEGPDFAADAVTQDELADGAVTFRALDGRDVLRDGLGCTGVDPDEPLSWTTDAAFYCSVNVPAVVATSALVLLDVAAEVGCDDSTRGDGTSITRSHLEVTHSWPGGSVVLPHELSWRVGDSREGLSSTRGNGELTERKAGHGAHALAMPLTLRPGDNEIEVSARFDADQCDPKPTNLWARYRIGHVQLVRLGQAE